MSPAPGEHLRRFVGDSVRFEIRNGNSAGGTLRAFLRTNLGRAAARRKEIIAAHVGHIAAAGLSWRDLPMRRNGEVWEIEIPLAETGYFKAKAYLLDEKKWQYWPDGPDVGISVHPDFARTANTIYCAFTRLFGPTRHLASTADAAREAQLRVLDSENFTVIPPSGKLRDLTRQLPHIVQTLGCRILQLLPVHPVPTTYARFGRFGSPYAALDLTAIDPALVEFDKRTTGVEQFCELTYAAHALGARVFLDIVINHTGWGSVLQENSPEFFVRKPDGEFQSPGAWGVVWEDLIELRQDSVLLWDRIADALLTWCRRDVDGFRCDAGYKIPVAAWQYIIARVQEEFPETIFLLEGLGGSWEATEQLLTEGGMHWAYSELFQNYSGKEVAGYLDYVHRQNERIGTYIHYSETHDNPRLAGKGRAWSLLRNRLCALTSSCGGFGFTCGVEWLATEKINVHECTGLNWGGADHLVPELAQLNRLLAEHPAFFDGAKLTRLSAPDSPVYALLRKSAEGRDTVLVLVNTAIEAAHSFALAVADFPFEISHFKWDLLGQPLPEISQSGGQIVFILAPGAVHCLATNEKPVGLSGPTYRRLRAQAALAVQALNQIRSAENFSGLDWEFLAQQIEASPRNFLAAAEAAGNTSRRQSAAPLPSGQMERELSDLIGRAARGELFPNVITWTLIDSRRVTPVPARHWLLIEDSAPFRATLRIAGEIPRHVSAVPSGKNFIAVFPPREAGAEAGLTLERYAAASQKISAAVVFLSPEPCPSTLKPKPDALVLLTNGRGGMARLCVDLGRVNSKYDAALAANLNPNFPVDRHVLVKRLRVWVNAGGFLSPLDFRNLAAFENDSAVAVWNFLVNAGDGRVVPLTLRAKMIPDQNTVLFQFERPHRPPAAGQPLPADAGVRLTVRFDIEDRNFHWETHRNGGAEFHFSTHTHPLEKEIGFAFTPEKDRQLRVVADTGQFHPQPEWCQNIPHPVEATRGLTASGDAYSPGWFELPLPAGGAVRLLATAETDVPTDLKIFRLEPEPPAAPDSFGERLLRAAKQFLVRRNGGRTVIAGYPWFLDWGRDTLICARGLLAAGLVDEVKQILLEFAGLEREGTLPNMVRGGDVSNRDTSDAPLWFALACEELSAAPGSARENFYDRPVNQTGRTVRDVVRSIAENYIRGTPNGICLDADTALIWSPAHFTWMDTNFPAGTPREGYPVEIQVLWIRLLRQLEKISAPPEQPQWRELAERAMASFDQLFWLEDRGWLADVRLAGRGVGARAATPSDALRSNGLLAVSLGLLTGERAKRCVAAAQKFLVVPGAVRSLAPLPVQTPLPVYGQDGRLLNNPVEPYWPRYEGDEDTRRKPAYHNGTAWVWMLPQFCEALVRAWDFSSAAVTAAKSYLSSAGDLLNSGCLGHLPEILDGDAPHTPRGCDAQAWSVTETLRVWKWLNSLPAQAQ